MVTEYLQKNSTETRAIISVAKLSSKVDRTMYSLINGEKSSCAFSPFRNTWSLLVIHCLLICSAHFSKWIHYILWWWMSCEVTSNSCDLMDCSPPGSFVHRLFQAKVLEWVAISFSRGSSWPRDQTLVSCTEGRFFTDRAPRSWVAGYLPSL